ncbi:hypothetical protein GGE65_006210 [Skermanella aerolata]|uniref:hypothetical protein n=1 Tax=Skermanella aerolata TaxID=393310 RepID=UPI003D233F19
MTQAALRNAMRAIDEAAAGLHYEDQMRRLAIVRAQLALLAREIEKGEEKVSSQILPRIAAE